MTNFERVKEFHRVFGLPSNSEPKFPDAKTIKLRMKLIHEEYEEFLEGLLDKNIVEVADALTDLLYVIYGTGDAFGINLDKCFEEVQRSNMSKLGPDGKPMINDYGKIIKGPMFSPPNLKDVLFNDNND